MVKKKLSIYLLLLSALLFLSLLRSTSYADYWTEEELKNIIYNYQTNFGENGTEEQIATFKSSLDSIDFSALSRASEDYDYFGLTCQANSWTNNNTKYVFYYGNYWDATNKPTLTNFYRQTRVYYKLNSNQIVYNTQYSYSSVNSTESQNGYTYDSWVLVPYDLYNAANGTTIVKAKGLYPSNLANGPYNSDYFDIDINADFRNNRATIKGDTSGTEYYLVPYSTSRIRIGNMFDLNNLEGVIKRKFRYKQSIRDFELVDEFQSNINNLEYYSIAEDTLVVYEYYQADTTEFITFVPKADSGFEQFTVALYFVTDNTSVTNGVIDNVVTFSGDYYNNYNNDTNTDKVINNINNDNDVEDMLQNFTSGDFAGNLGYEERENPFNTFILAFVYNVCNRLLSEDDVYWDYSMHGEPARRIYASDFTTPNTPLKTFVRLSMTFGALYLIYVQLRHYIELINEGNAAKVLHDVDADVYFYKM